MDKRAYNDSVWHNYCNKLEDRIRRSGEDYPTEEEIDKLLKYTQSAFKNPIWQTPALNRVFDIRRRWRTELQNRKRRERINEENKPMEEKLNLDTDVAASLFETITKIAQVNNIGTADSVTIKLSKEEGLILFKGASEKSDVDEVSGGEEDDEE